MPDTALLIPLAEALEVTVTELLLCRRCPSTEPMAPAAVEDAVKAAIAYPDTVHRSKRAWQASRKGLGWFLAALAAGAAGLFLGRRMGCLSEVLPVMMILAAVFGGYFWLLVPVRLPDFYDENRIGFYWDYCFRMNLPGVAFNNANWPRVVAVMRAWSCLVLALLPFLHLALTRFLPVQGLDRSYPFLFLGSLFLPLYFAGRQIGVSNRTVKENQKERSVYAPLDEMLDILISQGQNDYKPEQKQLLRLEDSLIFSENICSAVPMSEYNGASLH